MDGSSQEAPTCPPSPVLRDEGPFDKHDDGDEVDEDEDDTDDFEDWDAWAPTGMFDSDSITFPFHKYH